MLSYEKQLEAITAAAAEFPKEFGLAAYPGDRFKISTLASYHNGTQVMLYTQIKKGDQWLDFAKGTAAELRAQVRTIAPPPATHAETVLAFCKLCKTVYAFTRAQVPTAKCEPGRGGWRWNIQCPNCGGQLRRSSTGNTAPRKPLLEAQTVGGVQ